MDRINRIYRMDQRTAGDQKGRLGLLTAFINPVNSI
jgi:hypothetical protein